MAPRALAEIERDAGTYHGGSDALEALLPRPAAATDLVRVPDAQWLSTLSRCVFSAGFNWKVVEKKWPDFEAAYHGFAPGPCSMMTDEEIEAAAKAGGIPHMAKALSVRENAVLFRELTKSAGSAAQFFAQSPSNDFAGLLIMLKKRGNRLGGTTPQYFLRFMGVDGYVLTEDVVKALIREGVVDKTPTSAKALSATQAAFNAWAEESGRPLMAISRLLALSVG
ncbi:MAG: DNA-3-methyladenine glycosylase I [Pseudomonadota bacterium]